MTSKSHEVARKTLNLEDVRTAPVYLPPVDEQLRIVAEVERRLSVLDALERTTEQGLARAERLRQSILRRAFAGKLVPQDPSDEPASVLLERIRAERAAAVPVKRARRGRKAAAEVATAQALPGLEAGNARDTETDAGVRAKGERG